MAAGFFKRAMVYLGLVDDEYEDYEEYEPRVSASVGPRLAQRAGDDEDERPAPLSTTTSTIRPMTRDESTATMSSVSPRSTVRPVPMDAGARVHVVAPSRFGDAKEIADRLKDNRPVIVNLQMADRDLQRRMIDFCSGVTYALSGEMEKVADQVFLLAPTNVKVSDEERQRLVERGFGRD